jgi:hypothetical protein
MAALRQITKYYIPRLDRAGSDAVGYIHKHPGWEPDREYPMAMRLPTRNIVRFGSVAERDELLRDPSLYEDLDDLMTADGKNFQVTYSFPLRTRMNVFAGGQEYGAPGVTMRQLYDFLCGEYNGGERFVDSYFDYIFPSSPAGRMFAEFRSETARMVNTEYKKLTAARARKTAASGEADRRTREWRAVKEFRVWRDEAFVRKLDMLHKIIRKEIVQCLSTGRIPLRFKPAKETMLVRGKLGLDVLHGFYASGQLIESLQLSIRIPESAFRLTPEFREVPF